MFAYNSYLKVSQNNHKSCRDSIRFHLEKLISLPNWSWQQNQTAWLKQSSSALLTNLYTDTTSFTHIPRISILPLHYDDTIIAFHLCYTFIFQEILSFTAQWPWTVTKEMRHWVWMSQKMTQTSGSHSLYSDQRLIIKVSLYFQYHTTM